MLILTLNITQKNKHRVTFAAKHDSKPNNSDFNKQQTEDIMKLINFRHIIIHELSILNFKNK